MPAHPALHPRVEALRPSVFAVLAEKMARISRPILPLHIGDTYRQPPAAAWCSLPEHHSAQGLYAYGHPSGYAPLLEAVARKMREKNGLDWVGPADVQITAGATHGLFCTAQSLFGPDDEVLILAPFWPLILGIVQCTGARPIQVPFYEKMLENPELDPAELIQPYLTSRTAALYVNTPNNPDGCVLNRDQLQSIAQLCQSRGLWALSDEAYEDYLYDGRTHVSLASLPGMAGRTVSVYTFSKSHALSGLRIGWVVAPPTLIGTLRKVANHSVYNTSVLSQRSALAALDSGPDWLTETRGAYQQAADAMRTGLKGQFHPAQGGSYVFYDTSGAAPDVWTFIDRALEAGVSLAPGLAFGEAFASHVRICFTAVGPAALTDAIGRLNSIL